MTAEDIIQRLLDEKHITVKEAMVLIKAIAGIFVEDWVNKFRKKLDLPIKPVIDPDKRYPGSDIVAAYGVNLLPQTVMYGVQTFPSYNKAGDYICEDDHKIPTVTSRDNSSSIEYSSSAKTLD